MECKSLDIPDVKVLRPVKHEDDRGFFSEVYNARTLEGVDVHVDVKQENFAFSKEPYTVRGIHFQTPPCAQAKLIQVVSGAIYDVAVDLRKGSPWYGKWVAAEISAANWNQILVPVGFGHGLVTLEPNTAVIYKVTDFFSLENDKGLRWDCPDLNIDWPLGDHTPILSAKDQAAPTLADFDSPFIYQENS